jgi:hypothetical protein
MLSSSSPYAGSGLAPLAAVLLAIFNKDYHTPVPGCTAGLRQARAQGLITNCSRTHRPILTRDGHEYLRMAGLE